ncbi:MAG: hypothetical protein P1U50_08300 [Parvibaculaceae bacterium]|nr:hypothetical protein [Parvibaculaceae bacterium]
MTIFDTFYKPTLKLCTPGCPVDGAHEGEKRVVDTPLFKWNADRLAFHPLHLSILRQETSPAIDPAGLT